MYQPLLLSPWIYFLFWGVIFVLLVSQDTFSTVRRGLSFKGRRIALILFLSRHLPFSLFLLCFHPCNGHIAKSAEADAGDSMDVLDLFLPRRALGRSRAVPINGVESISFGVAIEPHPQSDGGIEHGVVDLPRQLFFNFFSICFVIRGIAVCLREGERFDIQLDP